MVVLIDSDEIKHASFVLLDSLFKQFEKQGNNHSMLHGKQFLYINKESMIFYIGILALK